jgi:carbon storage regulator
VLVLTRKPGEALKIGEDITLTILGVRGNQVRVGISAPKSLRIDRQEVLDRTQGGRVHVNQDTGERAAASADVTAVRTQ